VIKKHIGIICFAALGLGLLKRTFNHGINLPSSFYLVLPEPARFKAIFSKFS
jgi:hypothetical protein